MKFIVSDTINFLSKTFPKIYSSFYLEYLKQYASTYSVNKTQLRALITLKNNGAISMTALCNKLNIEKSIDIYWVNIGKYISLHLLRRKCFTCYSYYFVGISYFKSYK